MIVHHMPQGSPEWFAVRLGRLTGSQVKGILATLRGGGYAQSRADLCVQLCLERLTGRLFDENGYTNADMQHGIDTEPAARSAYQVHTGALVDEVGFCAHDDLMTGYSPDGLIGDDGLLEIKCPKMATHWRTLRSGGVAETYKAQVTHGLWVTGRAWCDVVSYDDRFPEGRQMVIERVVRDEAALAVHEQKVREFLALVDLEFAAMQGWSVVAR